MISALGASGSLLDALQLLSSSKSSSTAASSQSQNAPNPFDSGSSPQTQSSTAKGKSGQTGGGASISPRTMSALIDEQAKSDGSAVPSDSSDTKSNAISPNDPRIRHLALTVVQLPPINLVPIDPKYFSALTSDLNQGSTSPSPSTSA